MPEPNDRRVVTHADDVDQHVERKVTYETVSATTTRNSTVTIVIILIIALGLTVWILTQLR